MLTIFHEKSLDKEWILVLSRVKGDVKPGTASSPTNVANIVNTRTSTL